MHIGKRISLIAIVLTLCLLVVSCVDDPASSIASTSSEASISSENTSSIVPLSSATESPEFNDLPTWTQNDVMPYLFGYPNLLVSDDGWIYYSPEMNGGFYKMQTDGTGGTEIFSPTDYYSFVLQDGWIYYKTNSNSGLWKVKTDGTDNTQLVEQATGLPLGFQGDLIFYTANVGESSYVFSIHEDGTGQKQIMNYDHLNPTDGWINSYSNQIYTYNLNDNTYYSMNMDGSDKMKISDSTLNGPLCYQDGVLYYINRNDGYVYQMKTDGSDVMKISGHKTNPDTWTRLCVDNGWLYYLSPITVTSDGWSNSYKIYKVRTDGTDESLLCDTPASGLLGATGSHIYFQNYLEKGKAYVIKNDGTGLTELNLQY